ncbi:MAG: PorT family protein [Muribaculaceae bacterium]|nr:PorT family protein [Muribaculaceae bacterium]
MTRRLSIIAAPVAASALSLCAPQAAAQTHYAAQLSVGAKAGMDISRNFFNPSVDQTFKPGALAGVAFRYVEEDHFGIIAELEWIQRGWKESFEDAPYLYERTLSYLEIPVLAHIYFGRRAKFYANIGPLIGLRIGDSVKCNFDTHDTAALPDFPKWHSLTQYDEPIKQRIDYGICAGVGGEYSITPRHSMTVECRFYYGLGNLFGSTRKDNFNASNSMALEFTLGYWLRLR